MGSLLKENWVEERKKEQKEVQKSSHHQRQLLLKTTKVPRPPITRQKMRENND